MARRTPKWMGGEERCLAAPNKPSHVGSNFVDRGYLTTVRLRVRRHPAKGDPQKAPEGSMCSRLMHISSFLQDFIGRGAQMLGSHL